MGLKMWGHTVGLSKKFRKNKKNPKKYGGVPVWDSKVEVKLWGRTVGRTVGQFVGAYEGGVRWGRIVGEYEKNNVS